MKFESVKVGDIVYIGEAVMIGYSNRGRFWIPHEVSRVTPKQFLIGDDRYYKKDGSAIGGALFDYARNKGEDLGYEGIVKDQSTERNGLVSKLNKAYAISKMIDKLSIKYDHPNLDEIYCKITEASNFNQK